MLLKISPLGLHARVTRVETASPLSDSGSDTCMSVDQLSPHLNQPILQLVDMCHVCLVHFILYMILKDWSPVSSRP